MKPVPVRTTSGVSIILLCTILGLIFIPLLGIFVFEVNRFQFIQQQLERAVDSASLAGGTRLAEADPGDTNDTTERIRRRQCQAMEAARILFDDQIIVSVPALNNTTWFPGRTGSASGPVPALTVPPGPNSYAFRVTPADPAQGFASVPVGSPNGRAILCEAFFNEQPAFGRYLGLNAVPVYARSTSSIPRTDVVLCVDQSGSMDDSTRVSFVAKRLELTPEAAQALQALGQPPQLGDPKYGISDCNQQLADGCTDNFVAYDACIGPKCTAYQADFQAWQNAYNDIISTQKNPNNMFWNYRAVFRGQLYNILLSNNATSPDGTGSQINVLPHRHLNQLQPPPSGFLTNGNNPLRYRPPFNGLTNCGGLTTGFNQIVANLAPEVQQLDTAVQAPTAIFGDDQYPDFAGGATAISTSKFSPPGAYPFPNVATLYEASLGTLDNKTWPEVLAPHYASTAKYIALDDSKTKQGGYKRAYEESAKLSMQPIATVLEASELFFEALQGAGSSLKVGMVGYETQVADISSGKTYDPTDPKSGVYTANITDPNEPGIVRQVPSYFLRPSNDPAAIQAMIGSLDDMYSLRQTSMAAALRDARTILRADPNADQHRQYIVLLTDGRFTPPDDPRAEVQSWPDNKISIYAIGFYQNPVIASTARTILQDMVVDAGNGSAYYEPGDSATLRRIMQNLARRFVKLTPVN